jgi:hypothetical protein
MAKHWKIDVKRFEGEGNVGLLLENLRYAGVISKVNCEYSEDSVREFYSFSVYAPSGVHGRSWAEMNAERMRSFRINAEAKTY